jgi:hypothetical protein
VKRLDCFRYGGLLVQRFDCAEVLDLIADVVDQPAGHHSSPGIAGRLRQSVGVPGASFQFGRTSIQRPLLGQARQDALHRRRGFADSVTHLAIRVTVAPHCLHSLNSGLLVSVRNELILGHVESEWPLASAV